MSEIDALHVSKVDGVRRHLDKILIDARMKSLKPTGIIMAASDFVRFQLELSDIQRIARGGLNRPTEYQGVPIHITSLPIVDLIFNTDDASRIAWESSRWREGAE